MQKEILCKDLEVRMNSNGKKTDTKTMQMGNKLMRRVEEDDARLVGGAKWHRVLRDLLKN